MTDDAVVTALAALTGRPVTRHHLIRPGDRRLSHLAIGAGDGPAVVLVAGAGETALDWAPILPDLAATCRVVAYDRAGLGASDPSPAPTPTEQTADLLALLAGVGPAVLVGHTTTGRTR